VYRFNQKEPGSGTVVATGLDAPSSIAVDPVGNVFIAESGKNKISLIGYDQVLSVWSPASAGWVNLQYLAFSQY
jgi:DNA-binding beta-propeller fold protein YncE